MSVMPWAQSAHHIGQVVPDLEAAMERMSAQFAMRWEPLRRYELRVRDQGIDIDVSIGVTTSLDGPVRVELFEEAPGSPWTRRRGQPIHHLCYLVPDNVAEADRLMALGWQLEVTGSGPDEVNGFCYLVGPDGLRVEPKTADATTGGSPWAGGIAAGAS
jgi:catechol 2,3-dioxygenase-like lactoylglutathione lyase family enzyme